MVHEASGLPVISHSRHRETLITIACQKWGVEVVRPIPRNAPSIGDYGSIVVVAGEDDLELGQSCLLEVDNRVVLPAKSHICFIVTSADVPHSWVALSLGVKCDAILGRLNQTSILVQRERFYYGQYSEICGTNHAFMPIIVEAVPKKDYGSRERLGRRYFAKEVLSVREEGLFSFSFHCLTRFALQEREGICAGRKRHRSSYGHKEVSHRLDKAKNGTTLLTDYIRSEILNFKYNASWNGVALATVVYICQELHHSPSRLRARS
ncbi:cytochrome c oxidase subunit 2 [Capsicum annuum]|uniref:Cytochrome c oxidase polypeptide II n=1 Tax=Capsicum annuum TaxID=4072 RepID=A0A2G2Z6M9_CAPAN|nr:cytochrome c oxidase subunit 2 [Capsicum annuum]